MIAATWLPTGMWTAQPALSYRFDAPALLWPDDPEDDDRSALAAALTAAPVTGLSPEAYTVLASVAVSGTEADDAFGGSSGGDTLWGGSGDDRLSGLAGHDVIYGNIGVDNINGGAGMDTIYGGQNAGALTGDPLARRGRVETISGGADSDLIYGNIGNDLIYGGEGLDTLYGGQENDTIYGGQGYDHLYGNRGSDVFAFDAADTDGDDFIHDFSTTEDRLQLSGSVTVASSYGFSDQTQIVLSNGVTIWIAGVRIDDVSTVIDYVT